MMLWAISGVGVFEFRWLGWLQPGCSLLPRPGRRQRRKFPSRYRYRQWSPPHGGRGELLLHVDLPTSKVTISSPKARVKR